LFGNQKYIGMIFLMWGLSRDFSWKDENFLEFVFLYKIKIKKHAHTTLTIIQIFRRFEPTNLNFQNYPIRIPPQKTLKEPIKKLHH
jgi:hypothetical protein